MKVIHHLLPAIVLGTSTLAASAAPVEMQPANWQTTGQASYSTDAAHPHGILAIRGGAATLTGMTFSDGTIEYDIFEEPDNRGIPGIWFRQSDADTAENFYLRTDAGCPGSNECIQYAPVTRGNVEWDIYPAYQASAPVHATGWNHVKLVASGQRMLVYLNGAAQPSLSVPRLAGEAAAGAISLRGDARYANVDIKPYAVEELPPQALATSADTDQRFLRRWQIGPVGTLARGVDVTYAERPAADSPWETITAEPQGMVNIGRHHGTARGTPDLAWLKTTVQSDRAQVKHVSFGYAREAWVWVNGKPVFSGRNPYYPATVRKGQARMDLGNADFDVPLAPGPNTIEIAVSNDMPSTRHWGWAFAFHFDGMEGITMATPSTSM